jgi:hypothetical protein
MVAIAFSINASIAFAQIVEVGDAGSSVPGAQGTGAVAHQPLLTIAGGIMPAGDADFFVINITNPALFSATTIGGSLLDTMLYLFDMNGNPVYLNDDATGGASLQSMLPTGNLWGPQLAGTYILGISLSSVDPVSISNQLLFASALFSTDVRGPAPGAIGPVAGVLDSSSFPEFGAYLITLTGAETALAIPEPTTTALLATCAVGALIALRRRVHRK